MKVTAILSDELIHEIQAFSGGKNITESLSLALTEWLKIAKLRKLNEKLKDNPIEFQADYTSENIRNLNRRRS